MQLQPIEGGYALVKENDVIGHCLLENREDAVFLWEFFVQPRWRRHGYGSYLLREVLRATGGYSVGQESCHRARIPANEAERDFWQRFGFSAIGGSLVRFHRPDLTAVAFAHEFLTSRLPQGGFAVDATCGNGHDTEFLCRAVGPTGHVLALDIQAKAVKSTRGRLADAGLTNAKVVKADHADLATLAQAGTADCVLFNFGWLPGADHAVHSTHASSLPALEAALELLHPGGVLSCVLYSGREIGDSEKQAVLTWLRGLSIEKYTVLICEFANWDPTAPLPCFVLKK